MEFQNSIQVHRTADQVSVGYYCGYKAIVRAKTDKTEILCTGRRVTDSLACQNKWR